MTDLATWKTTIEAAMATRPPPVKAHTYLGKKWVSNANPVALACDDGNGYVVKGAQMGRVLCNEQIVARIGRVIGAPVPDVTLVDVLAELITVEPDLGHMAPGIGNGSVLVNDCSDRVWINHVDVPDNRLRFAALAILYGLIPANDHQLIYRTHSPFTVYSVDHGHFFPGGPPWTIASLAGAPAVQPYQELVNGCHLTHDELSTAAESLKELTDERIAAAVAAPADTWSLSLQERVAVADYLSKRASQMSGLFANN